MKRHTLIAVAGAIFSLALIAIPIIIFANPEHPLSSSSTANGTRTFDLGNLASGVAIRMNGSLTLDISNGPPSIEVLGPEDYISQLEVSQGRNSLELIVPNRWGFRPDIQVNLSLPDVSSLEISGSSRVRIASVQRDTFEIKIEGDSDIEVASGRVDTLRLSISGRGNFTSAAFVSQNAIVKLEGLNSAKLNMGGGKLEGSLEGFGSITYAGSIAENAVRINGLGTVEKED